MLACAGNRAQLSHPDPEPGALVTEAFRLYASGECRLEQLATKMEARGCACAPGAAVRLGRSPSTDCAGAGQPLLTTASPVANWARRHWLLRDPDVAVQAHVLHATRSRRVPFASAVTPTALWYAPARDSDA